MSTASGKGQRSGFRHQAVEGFGISRSCLGRLRVRFEGGPSYPAMVETLEGIVKRYGYLVRCGETISGSAWIQRIDQSGGHISDLEIRAIQTLMGI